MFIESMRKKSDRVGAQQGFIILDGMIIMGCCLFWLAALMFFHLQYVHYMQRVVKKLSLIEYAQEALGHLRNNDHFVFESTRAVSLVVQEYRDTHIPVTWVRATVTDGDEVCSLYTVCL